MKICPKCGYNEDSIGVIGESVEILAGVRNAYEKKQIDVQTFGVINRALNPSMPTNYHKVFMKYCYIDNYDRNVALINARYDEFLWGLAWNRLCIKNVGKKRMGELKTAFKKELIEKFPECVDFIN